MLKIFWKGVLYVNIICIEICEVGVFVFRFWIEIGEFYNKLIYWGLKIGNFDKINLNLERFFGESCNKNL